MLTFIPLVPPSPQTFQQMFSTTFTFNSHSNASHFMYSSPFRFNLHQSQIHTSRFSQPVTCRVGERRTDTRKAMANDEHEWSPEKLGFTEIGLITGCHGVRGEVKVMSDSDFAKARLTVPNSKRYLLLPGRVYPRPILIKGGKKASQKNAWIVHFDYLDDRDEAFQLRGARLYVKHEDRPRLRNGEYMVSDLIGSKVVHLDNVSNIIGIVSGIITAEELHRASGNKSGEILGNDIIEIRLLQDQADDIYDLRQDTIYETALIPFVKQIVPTVNLQDNLIIITPPHGLIDSTKVKNKPKKIYPRALLMAAKDHPQPFQS